MTAAVPASEAHTDGRRAAFLNTASQCVEMIGGCLATLDSEEGLAAPVVETYFRGLKTLGAAAYQQRPELEELVALQLTILICRQRWINTCR